MKQVALVIGCCVWTLLLVLLSGFCWYNHNWVGAVPWTIVTISFVRAWFRP